MDEAVGQTSQKLYITGRKDKPTKKKYIYQGVDI